MHTLIYTSRAAGGFDRPTLTAILAVARKRNGRADVTGLLLYDDRSFLQVLEGPEEAVRATFARIAADDRHTDIEVLVDGPGVRVHSDWSMAFHHLDELALGPGPIDAATAEDLLASFAGPSS